MESSVGGMLILGVLMVAVVLMSRVHIVSNAMMGTAMKQAAELSGERTRTMLSQEYAASDGTSLRVDVENTGSVSISDYAHMDVIVEYRSIYGSTQYKRLTYVDGTPGNNQWTDRYITPDRFQSGMWDPGEELDLRATLDPAHATSTIGTVTVASPNGVAATGSFSVPHWVLLEGSPNTVTDGGALTADGSYVYAFRGGTTDFWRYNPGEARWISQANTPLATGSGGAMVYTNGYIYALRGASADFWRYNINGRSWEARDSTLTPVDVGGALTWDGADTIYAFRGQNQSTFWEYSISGDIWTAATSTPTPLDAGAALAFASGDVYAFRGNITTDFWKLDLTSGIWNSLASAPLAVAGGGALVWAGGDYIYALGGNASNEFWRYSISRNNWESPAITPGTVSGGGALAYKDGDIYALRGNATSDFWLFQPPDF